MELKSWIFPKSLSNFLQNLSSFRVIRHIFEKISQSFKKFLKICQNFKKFLKFDEKFTNFNLNFQKIFDIKKHFQIKKTAKFHIKFVKITKKELKILCRIEQFAFKLKKKLLKKFEILNIFWKFVNFFNCTIFYKIIVSKNFLRKYWKFLF